MPRYVPMKGDFVVLTFAPQDTVWCITLRPRRMFRAEFPNRARQRYFADK